MDWPIKTRKGYKRALSKVRLRHLRVLVCLALCGGALSSTHAVEPISGNILEATPEKTAEKPLTKTPFKVRDLEFGAVLFDFYRDQPLPALTRLMAAQARQHLPHHPRQTALLQGRLYLEYGLYQQAQRLIEPLLSHPDDAPSRAQAQFLLAQVYYRQGNLLRAAQLLDGAGEHLRAEQQNHRLLMLANIATAQGKLAAALDHLRLVTGNDKQLQFSRYNQAVTLLRMGLYEEAYELLSHVTEMSTNDPVMQSLRDRAHVTLGFHYLQQEKQGEARQELLKVRLLGPFADQALLGMGWAYIKSGMPDRALVHWQELTEKVSVKPAGQEALLAVPYAYRELDAMQESLAGYQRALSRYQQNAALLEQAIGLVRDEKFITSLLQQASADSFSPNTFWRSVDVTLGRDTETPFLAELISGHTFNEAFKDIQELKHLHAIIEHWQKQLPILKQMKRLHVQRFVQRNEQLDSGEIAETLARRELEYARLKAILAKAESENDPWLLAGKKELNALNRIELAERRVERIQQAASLPVSQPVSQQEERLSFVRGALLWRVSRDFPVRLRAHKKLLTDILDQLVILRERMQAIAASEQKAADRFEQFDERIDRIEKRLETTQLAARDLQQRVQQRLQQLAIEELETRKQELQAFQLQAELAIARLHDQATQLQQVSQ